jgi:hypothetical protein
MNRGDYDYNHVTSSMQFLGILTVLGILTGVGLTLGLIVLLVLL